MRRLTAAMENASLPDDVWNNVTTSSPQSQYLTYIRILAFKIIYIVIGTVGVLDNLFVIIVFALFVKITDKVLTLRMFKLSNRPSLRNFFRTFVNFVYGATLRNKFQFMGE